MTERVFFADALIADKRRSHDDAYAHAPLLPHPLQKVAGPL